MFLNIPSKNINVETTLIVNIHQRCFNDDIWKQRWKRWKWKFNQSTFTNVVSTLTKQLWNNVDRITSIQRWWTNVVSLLKFGWKWKLCWRNVYRRRFNTDKTTLKQRWKNCVDSMLMTQCCFNVDIWLKGKVESTYVHRRWENSIKKTLSALVVLMFTRKWLNNKTKLSFQV